MNTFHNVTLAIGMPGPWEWAIIAVIGVLIFGKRLPEVGRGVGRGIVEFKKGLAGIDDEVDAAVNRKKEIDDDAGNTTKVETGAETKTSA